MALLVTTLGMPVSAATQGVAAISFHAWTTAAQFAAGTFDGTTAAAVGDGAITLPSGATVGQWTSTVYKSLSPITEVVTSWQANTPPGSWVETDLSLYMSGHWTKWYVMGQWAFDESAIQRTSVGGQGDSDGYVSIDTWFADKKAGSASAYKVRSVLHSDGSAEPVLRQVAATASDQTKPSKTVSPTTMTSAIDLPVPQYSQEIHSGEYPQFDGGGEAWCSPTSTEMVVEFWGRGPTASDIASLPADPVFDANGRVDGSVDWAAVHTYDYHYQGTGNWPFNTAYAAHYGLDSSVRQYADLRGIERWIKRGVPVVVSIAWNKMDGADIKKTNGHLLVVRGFTASGDVIVNDPASPDDATVRHVYQRDQFEYNWLSASNGIVYIIKPYSIPG